LSETTLRILKDVEQIKPARVVFDSLSELRLSVRQSAALSPADPGPQAVLFAGRSARCCCSTT
jgi:hypothetical protein